MIVTEISPFKGSMVCVVLRQEDGHDDMKFYIHKDTLMDNGVAVGKVMTEEDAHGLICQNDFRRARERALYLLEGREYSYSMLYDRLEKNYTEDICFEVCNNLKELGLLNDERYAEKLCRKLFETKRYGKYRVKQEMRAKGVPMEIIEAAIDEFMENDEEAFERLERLVEQKYERYLTDKKGVAKVRAALARMGYSYGEIREVLDLYDLDFDE